ncbi:hypothetical protein HDK64DRAFT_21401 [Phyllosticta capitalensis]
MLLLYKSNTRQRRHGVISVSVSTDYVGCRCSFSLFSFLCLAVCQALISVFLSQALQQRASIWFGAKGRSQFTAILSLTRFANFIYSHLVPVAIKRLPLKKWSSKIMSDCQILALTARIASYSCIGLWSRCC